MRGSVEIVGGGIGGLFAGYVLAKQGWRVRVNERSPSIREIGAGIFLKNNSVTILEHLGIADRVLKNAVWLRRAEIRDHDDKILQRRDLIGGARVFNLPRTDLVLGLANVARDAGVEIRTNSTVVKTEPAGSIHFENGEVQKADLIIAADGFRSRTRQQLKLEITAKELATGATRYLVPRTDFEPENMTREWWSGRRRIGIAPASEKLTYTYMSCPQADAAGIALPVAIESWKRSFPTISSFFDKLDGASGGTRYAYGLVRCRRWSQGRVALVGDAAHGLPPTLGQGAGCTLMNIYVLADELSRAKEVLPALMSWEDRIRYVTDETQKWSLRYDALMANWPLWLSSIRRGVIWSVGHFKSVNNRMRIADWVDVTTSGAANGWTQ